MIALWEKDHQLVSELGDRLSLDSGTLTPLLKKLEHDGRIKRTRDKIDERKVWIDLTDAGIALSEQAKTVPLELIKCVNLPKEDGMQLFTLLTKLHQTSMTCDNNESET